MNRGIRGVALTVIGMLCLVAASAPAAAKGKDAFVGNWQMDSAKSTFTGRPAFQSAKVSITAIKGGRKVAGDVVAADGQKVHYEYAGPSDGSSIAVTGAPMYDSISLLEPDKTTMVRTERRAGKVVGITTATLDKGGKSFTVNGRGTAPDGKQFTVVLVYNKVK